MTNRCPESRVVLISNAANPSFHFIVILLIEILHDIKLHIPSPLRSEPIDRVDVADSFECLAHQHETFFLNLDDPASGSRVWLQRMTTNRACGRRRLVQEERNRHVASAPQTLRVNPLGLLSISTSINHIVNDGIEMKLLAVDLVGN